jgi:hypothetical protein
MRKFVFLALLLALSAAPAAAQTIGFKVGPTFATLDVSDNAGDEPETLTSFGGGGFIRFGMLQLELLAVTKGAEMSFDDGTGGTVTGKFKVTHVDVPVTAVFSLPAGPYFFAGPYVGFEVGCEVEGESGGVNVEFDCDEGGELERKKVDFGLTGGAGVRFPVGPGAILLEGRYSHGLSDLNDSDVDDESIKSRYFAVMAGYSIRIGL